jgi:NMD protein affecting ribosome stability and mRNA decay
MARLSNWINLECLECGCDNFYASVYLRRHPTSGTSEDPAGYVCRQCGVDVDTNKMWHKILVQRRKSDLEELMKEMELGLDPSLENEESLELLALMDNVQKVPEEEEPEPAKRRSSRNNLRQKSDT